MPPNNRLGGNMYNDKPVPPPQGEVMASGAGEGSRGMGGTPLAVPSPVLPYGDTAGWHFPASFAVSRGQWKVTLDPAPQAP